MLERIWELGIKAHAELLAEIVIDGPIGVVVFEPSDEMKEAAKSLGWDGQSPVFRMSNATRKRLAQTSAATGDHVTGQWYASRRPGRILVLAQRGVLLVNHHPGTGFSLEPGSTDAERAS
jgi:hypothetical protein